MYHPDPYYNNGLERIFTIPSTFLVRICEAREAESGMFLHMKGKWLYIWGSVVDPFKTSNVRIFVPGDMPQSTDQLPNWTWITVPAHQKPFKSLH